VENLYLSSILKYITQCSLWKEKAVMLITEARNQDLEA